MACTCEELSYFFYTFSYATIYSISLQLFAKNFINGICFFTFLDNSIGNLFLEKPRNQINLEAKIEACMIASRLLFNFNCFSTFSEEIFRFNNCHLRGLNLKDLGYATSSDMSKKVH